MIDLSSPPVDEDVVARVRAGDPAQFEVLMRRYNARLFRVARAIVADDDEAEDVVQESYVRAWSKLHQFEGRASFATWLTRIAVHEALARVRRRSRLVALGVGRDDEVVERGRLQMAGGDQVIDEGPGPAEIAAGRELMARLQAAIDDLPDAYRLVFVLREVEGLSGAEAADALETTEGAVKVRLHRARVALRNSLQHSSNDLKEVYAFHATRCDRVVRRVFERIHVGGLRPGRGG
ncbi:MAG: RNA polymerase sigma factor [Vicinamibacterales bacterium]